MPVALLPTVTLTPVAHFPEKYFLENLAVRADGSVLITAVLQQELWCVPEPKPTADVAPVLVHTFDHLISGIAEVEPEVFIICSVPASPRPLAEYRDSTWIAGCERCRASLIDECVRTGFAPRIA